jgi:hypothetical protein
MVKGLIQGGTVANGTKIFNLPSGYRPASRMLLPAVTYSVTPPGAHARIDVDPNGDVFIMDGGNATWISLDAVSFYAG